MDSFEKLIEAKKLFDQGIINSDEYQQLKGRLLNEIDNDREDIASPSKEHTESAEVNAPTAQSSVNGEGASTGIKILCFLIPLAGLIMFLTDREKKPAEAKDEITFAGIGFGVSILLYLLFIVGAFSSSSYY